MECSSVNPLISSTFLRTRNLPTYHTYPSISTAISFTGFSCIQVSPNSHIPNCSSTILCCSSHTADFPKILLKKIAVSLVVTGSVLLMGGCLCRTPAALALPAHREEKRTGEVNDVEIMWERFLDKNPRDVDAMKIVLYEKMSKGKNSEAMKYVERLIELEQDEVEWRLLQALCYEMMGYFTTAKRLFEDILKERPLLLRALHGLAMVMHKNSEGPAVYEMLNEALELARHDKRVTEVRNISILIAQMHVVKGELEEGLVKFQGLIDENPRDFRPYLCQGIILSLLDRKEEAEQQFMTYHSLVPEEFPQKRFLDDIVFEAKTKSREYLQKDIEAQFAPSPSAHHRTTNVP